MNEFVKFVRFGFSNEFNFKSKIEFVDHHYHRLMMNMVRKGERERDTEGKTTCKRNGVEWSGGREKVEIENPEKKNYEEWKKMESFIIILVVVYMCETNQTKRKGRER